ncbi:MAG: M1 family aminopeptidase [Gemmataceae bacterium]
MVRAAPGTPLPPPASAAASPLPAHLPRYKVEVDLNVDDRLARVQQVATWTNPTATPTDRLVFNVHSRYVVPDNEIGFMAKMLEILRVQPSEGLGYKEPPCEVREVCLVGDPAGPRALAFGFEGDTKTTMVVRLPRPVAGGESVTVAIDLTMHLPPKQGRWGQWEGVTQLANWLPVFAYYGEGGWGPGGQHHRRRSGQSLSEKGPAVVRATAEAGDDAVSWRPVPFVPWHQPFFNEAGIYEVGVTLPCDQEIACTGTMVAVSTLATGRKRVEIRAVGVREFTLIVSHRFKVYEGRANAGPGGAPVRVRVLAFPEHEFYARQMVRISVEALEIYSKWLTPYPWPDFTIAETFFGWNGNECSNLVMIDERVFAMPHVAVNYVDYLLSHEICHQWWYNLIGTNGYCETWMDEALANYLSHCLVNHKNGRESVYLMTYPSWLEWLPNIRRDDYRSSGMYGTIGRGDNAPIVQEMPKFGHLGNLFSLCYDKGGRVVAMIEERMGQPAFRDFIRRLACKYQYRVIRVADFRRELETYTGRNWDEFFDNWLYGKGLCDWAVDKVTIIRPPTCQQPLTRCCRWRRRWVVARAAAAEEEMLPPERTRLQIHVSQREEFDEPTTLGIALPGEDGFPIRIPILPGAADYRLESPPTRVTRLPPAAKGGASFLVEVELDGEPTQVTLDPDQVLVDTNPANNSWHPPIRWRFAPLYTFLEETDLTNAYDRWNMIFGPWIYTPAYENAWFTQSTMAGLRLGAYRTQQFVGGGYAAYRTSFRDVVAGVDGMWDHWPFPRSQVGFMAEQRVAESNSGDRDARRAVLWGRYVFLYGSSLYLPPMHYLESFVQYSDNFLPFPTQQPVEGIRYDQTTTAGLHYRLNLLTPYWDPEGGFRVDAWYEGGIAQSPSTVALNKISGFVSAVKSPPNLSHQVEGLPFLRKSFDWLADTRVAVRLYGAAASPTKGEFYSMGGSELFRGFDLAQRQGSAVWVGSVEWRVPVARQVHYDVFDHVASLRNVYTAFFYDVGNTYTDGRSVGPVAHGVGVGLRLDVAWFSFVERTTLRLDFAKAVNLDTGPQVWFGVNHPF